MCFSFNCEIERFLARIASYIELLLVCVCTTPRAHSCLSEPEVALILPVFDERAVAFALTASHVKLFPALSFACEARLLLGLFAIPSVHSC